MLRALAACAGSRDDAAVWDEICGALCHQGTVYTATYAAVPHIVELANEVPIARQVPYWSFVAAVTTSTDAAWLSDDLRAAFDEALERAAAAVDRALQAGPATETDALYLLQAAAATRGWTVWARILYGLIDGEVCPRCPACGWELSVLVGVDELTVAQQDAVSPRRTVEPRPASALREGRLDDLASLAVRAGFDSIAARLRLLGGVVACPSCGCSFRLADELIAGEERTADQEPGR